MWLSLAPMLAGDQVSFGHPSLFYSIIGKNCFYTRWICIFTSQSGPHTNKVKFPACAVNLVYHMLPFASFGALPAVTVLSQGASTEASPFYGRHSQFGAYRYL